MKAHFTRDRWINQSFPGDFTLEEASSPWLRWYICNLDDLLSRISHPVKHISDPTAACLTPSQSRRLSDSLDRKASEYVMSYPCSHCRALLTWEPEILPSPWDSAGYTWKNSHPSLLTHTHLFYIVIKMTLCLHGVLLTSLYKCKWSWVPESGVCRLYVTLFFNIP